MAKLKSYVLFKSTAVEGSLSDVRLLQNYAFGSSVGTRVYETMVRNKLRKERDAKTKQASPVKGNLIIKKAALCNTTGREMRIK